MNNITNNYFVNFGTNQSKVQDKSKEQTTEKDTNKSYSKLVGTVAVAAIMTGIILISNKKKLNLKNNNSNDINYIREQLSKLEGQPIYKQTFDNKKTKQSLKKIINSIKKGNTAELESAKKAITDKYKFLSKIEHYPDDLPKDIKKAIQEKDYIKAYKLYAEYADNLYTVSKTAGKTKAQSVEKFFGKNTSIRAHNYDLTKESDKIVTTLYNDAEEYINVTINSENKMPARHINWKNSSSYEPTIDNEKIQDVVVSQKTYNGKKYVTIQYPSDTKNYDNEIVANAITIISPDNQLTPVQRDLLSIKNLGDKIDILKSLTKDEDRTNFDAILSVISTFAGK